MTNTNVTTINDDVNIPAEPSAPVTEGTWYNITRRAYVIFENNTWLVVVDDVELSTYNDFNRAVHIATAFRGPKQEW